MEIDKIEVFPLAAKVTSLDSKLVNFDKVHNRRSKNIYIYTFSKSQYTCILICTYSKINPNFVDGIEYPQTKTSSWEKISRYRKKMTCFAIPIMIL